MPISFNTIIIISRSHRDHLRLLQLLMAWMEHRVLPVARLVIRLVVSYLLLRVMGANLDGAHTHKRVVVPSRWRRPLVVVVVVVALALAGLMARILSDLIWLEVNLGVELVVPVAAALVLVQAVLLLVLQGTADVCMQSGIVSRLRLMRLV